MDNMVVYNVVNKLNLSDFESFAAFFFENIYQGTISKHSMIKNAMVRDLEAPIGQYKGIYLPHCIPYELYSNPYDIPVDSPYIRKKLQIIFDEYKNKYNITLFPGKLANQLMAIYFINNLVGFPFKFYDNYMIDEYIKLLKIAGINFIEEDAVYVGNFDSFIDKDPEKVITLINAYMQKSFEIAISLSNNRINVNKFISDKHITTGVGKTSKLPYHSLITDQIDDKKEIIKEFEYLLNNFSSENTLENFLFKYYKDIFGNKYDRIETQVWLKFPEIDISNKNRKLDIFLHNSIVKDWELYELKKVMPMTKYYRDIPVFTNEIYSAIQQLKNYERTLKNHSVKERLKYDGIEYFEPSLNLVIGRTSILPHDEWRWLIESNKDVKILTYDDLLAEMSFRLKSHIEFFESMDK